MRPLPAAVLLTATIAGPPLYSLVSSGNLDGDNAVFKAAIVLVGCLIGAQYIESLAVGYRREQVRAERRREVAVRRRLEGLMDDDGSYPP